MAARLMLFLAVLSGGLTIYLIWRWCCLVFSGERLAEYRLRRHGLQGAGGAGAGKGIGNASSGGNVGGGGGGSSGRADGPASPASGGGGFLVAGIRRLPARWSMGEERRRGGRSPFTARLGKLFYGKKRQKLLEGQIVEALTLISSSLKAGYSFIQSMEMVAREIPPPLGQEFAQTLHEMSLGATVDDALQEMSRRAAMDDLDLVVTAVLIQRQVGGNLTEVLDNIALTIRERIRIRGEIKTLTAQGRISGWIIGLLPIFIAGAILLINPGYISPLFRHPFGILAICLGLLGQVLGILVIRKIVDIEV